MTKNPAPPRRWHANPDPRLQNSGDTIDRHQDAVARLCHSAAIIAGIDLDRSDLIYAAEKHDEAERVLGDTPGPAKERFSKFADALAAVERIVLREMGLTWRLTRKEQDILHLCDKLEAWHWAVLCGCGDEPEWQAVRRKLEARAEIIDPNIGAWLRVFTEQAITGNTGKTPEDTP